MSDPHKPTADVSVRIAWADDAPPVARVQQAAWREQYAGLVGEEALPTSEQLEQAWTQSLQRPREARNRLLVALERNTVVGFVITVPSADPDRDPGAVGEVQELTVTPDRRGLGHGSRLLQAAVDTLVADGFSQAVTWAIASDDALRSFLAEAGWAPDSAHRELDLDGSGRTLVKQVRLHTALG